MGETRVVGSAGGVLLTLETGSGQVAISQDDDLVVLNLTDAGLFSCAIRRSHCFGEGRRG
jgi:hypothetical protein